MSTDYSEVITDRHDLDKQIHTNFGNTHIVKENCRAESGAHLRQLLTEDHRFIFTLIQKFGIKPGEKYPKLSDALASFSKSWISPRAVVRASRKCERRWKGTVRRNQGFRPTKPERIS